MSMESIQNNRKPAAVKMLMAAAVLVLMIIAGFGMNRTDADQLTPAFESSDGYDCDKISDGSYFTTDLYEPGTDITITAGETIDSLYIVWENIPGEWTLEVNGNEYKYGKDGYLHEYVKLPEAASSVKIKAVDSRLTIADVYAFSAGELPSFVQQWNAPCEDADILLISTHADDEVLFFGGIIPNYIDRGARIQVAYFTDLFQTESYRNHEILNGLWKMGVTHYPQLGEFTDVYSESYEEAAEQYDYDASLEYIVRTIRRFHPQVVIGQDPENGEYGHGGHMWCARIIEDALEVTSDASVYPESAEEYGTWDVKKTYFHLYPENQIVIDVRTPLASFGGKTDLEVAREAYLEHESQQWCWFYVTDDGYDADGNYDEKGYIARCNVYGLYRTTVGADTGNDILENITMLGEPETEAETETVQETQAAAEENTAAAENTEEGGDVPEAQSVVNQSSSNSLHGGSHTTILTILIIIAVILLVAIIGIVVISKQKEKIRSRQRMLNRKAKMHNAASHDSRTGHPVSSSGRNSGNSVRQSSGSGYGMRSRANASGPVSSGRTENRSQGVRSRANASGESGRQGKGHSTNRTYR